MIIAKEKKRTNIAEYVLYMWQIEDVLRALQFDLEKVEERIISQQELDKFQLEETRIWYKDLIEKMDSEQIKVKGHLAFVRDTVRSLEDLHQKLIQDKENKKYQDLYNWAQKNIDDLREKIHSPQVGDVEICLTGLYGLLLLRLKQSTVSEETKAAMQTFSNLLSQLSFEYKSAKA